ncbi:NF-kappa-B essential modulator-like [Scyliorhinus torazame]|uniref:NF-kappa-B essential modulator-like n=1 Tax=Scyliorhinus torazame TaxID=75743 RepID=UPI003B5B50E6
MSRGQGTSLSEMVQPSGIVGSEPEMVSEEAPRGPLPVACSQATDLGSLSIMLQQNQELQMENVSLREAIRQSNEALKERCEELQEFRMKNRKEKELVASRFEEARTLVEQLRSANNELRRGAEGSKEEEEAMGAGQNGGSAQQLSHLLQHHHPELVRQHGRPEPGGQVVGPCGRQSSG